LALYRWLYTENSETHDKELTHMNNNDKPRVRVPDYELNDALLAQ